MPCVVYSLDNVINRFFSDVGVASSRAECDDIARQKFGGLVQPVAIQGSNSYTVVAGPDGDKVIKFREQAALLDVELVALAKSIHGDLVPSCSEIGRVGKANGPQLVAYAMERLPGDNCVTARFSLAVEKRLSIATSLATFFAQAWQKSTTLALRSVDIDRARIRADCYASFEYLARTLPERFAPAVAEVQAALPSLLEGYPVVLTHADLNEMDILINPSSGEITGIVDWSSASIQPFGFALYASDNALGNMGNDGWKWYENADEMRDSFWAVFKEQTGLPESQLKLVQLAEKAGILIGYGTAYDSGFSGLIGVRDPNGDDFRF